MLLLPFRVSVIAPPPDCEIPLIAKLLLFLMLIAPLVVFVPLKLLKLLFALVNVRPVAEVVFSVEALIPVADASIKPLEESVTVFSIRLLPIVLLKNVIFPPVIERLLLLVICRVTFFVPPRVMLFVPVLPVLPVTLTLPVFTKLIVSAVLPVAKVFMLVKLSVAVLSE